MFERLTAEHFAGQRVWGIFQATGTSIALLTAVLTLRTSSDLIRDLGAQLDPTPTVQALASGSRAIRSIVEAPSACNLIDLSGSPGEKELHGFVKKSIPGAMGTATNLLTNVCTTVERQADHAELVRTHPRVLARLKSELAKWSERARALRTQLAGIESKRRGLERQCTAFTDQQRRVADPRLMEFAMGDSERSRGINEMRLDAQLQRNASSAAATDSALQQLQSQATRLGMAQQLRALNARSSNGRGQTRSTTSAASSIPMREVRKCVASDYHPGRGADACLCTRYENVMVPAY